MKKRDKKTSNKLNKLGTKRALYEKARRKKFLEKKNSKLVSHQEHETV